MTPRLGHTVMSCLHLLIQSRSHFRSHRPLQDPQLYFGGSSFDVTVCRLKPRRFRQVYSMQHIQDLLTGVFCEDQSAVFIMSVIETLFSKAIDTEVKCLS